MGEGTTTRRVPLPDRLPLTKWLQRVAAVAIARPTLLTAIGLLLFGLCVYHDFVFGPKTLLYKDIGADSLNIFYPNFVLRSDYLREHGVFNWSFQVGMGDNISPSITMLLLYPVVWLPKAAIAYALVYQHLLYVLISGFCFFRFLSGRGLAVISCFLGAVLLAFSAYMCMGSCWYVHAGEVALFSVLLLSADNAVRNQKWMYLVAAVAAMSLMGAFHLYLTAIFLSLFVPANLLLGGASARFLVRNTLLLAAAAALGAGFSAITSIDGFFALLHSPRGTGPASLATALSSVPIISLESAKHYATAVLRLLSNDLAGTGTDFKGWQNYLEAPMSYCGLLCLIILPQAFVRMGLRQRIVSGAFLLYLVVPTIFPWFRSLFWGFQGDYYRTFSLFGVLGMIALAMRAFSHFRRGGPINLLMLGATSFLILGALFAPISEIQLIMDPSLRWVVAAFVVIYTLLLGGGTLLKREGAACWIISGVVLIEMFCFDRRTIDRPVVTWPELHERVGYNDFTVEAVRDIKARESSRFFRITKTFGSSPAMFESLNDALVFNYFGTSSYSSFNNLNYIRFLLALDTIDPEQLSTLTHWSLGLLGHPLLLTFAGEKYVVTNDAGPYRELEQYKRLGEYGSYTVFQNEVFLPLGLFFRSCISEEQFGSLSPSEKQECLVHAAVLDKPDRISGVGRLTAEALRRQLQEQSLVDKLLTLRADGLRLIHFEESRFGGDINVSGPGILILQMPFDFGWHSTIDGRAEEPFLADVGLCGLFVPTEGMHHIEFFYQPPYRFIGACVSLASVVVFAGIYFVRLRRRSV